MIYAVNMRTKEHVDVTDMHMPEVAEFINGAEWKLTHADADGWIEWEGKDSSPVPLDSRFEVRLRNGVQDEEILGKWMHGHTDKHFDIVAYRPILDAKRGLLQNSRNQTTQTRRKSSRFKGVCWDKNRGKWQASTKVMGRRIYLGRYADEEEAANAYNEYAKRQFGEYAAINEVE